MGVGLTPGGLGPQASKPKGLGVSANMPQMTMAVVILDPGRGRRKGVTDT